MNAKELSEILSLHAAWARGESGGKRADLSDADLSRANLYRADLSDADLSSADLSRANLYRANLYRADLSDADLSGADLSRANLSGANLSGADLSGANLSGADLSRANLYRANLSGADLSPVDAARLSIVPESGSFEGWKKCVNGILVRVEIPADARRSNSTGRKCRAERVIVREIVGAESAVSMHDKTVVYRVGKMVTADSWDENKWNECSHGIHFFLTRTEAEAF